MKNPERRLELTSKFVQMGKALVDESRLLDDPIIGQLGSMLIFLGGICFDDDDVMKFGDLVSMYSAKKLMEALEENNDPMIMGLRKKAENDTYENILDGVQDLIDGAKNFFDEDNEEDDEEGDEDKD